MNKELLQKLLDSGEISQLAFDAMMSQPPAGAKSIGDVGDDAAVAQGDGAMAANERAVQNSGTIHGHAVTGDGVTINEAPEDPAEIACRTYLKRLHDRCNALPLAAMGEDQGADKNIGLTHVYIALDTQSRTPLTAEEQEQAKRSIEVLGGRGDGKTRPLSALEVTEQHKRLVLLGGPGSGKSSFVRQLVANKARAWHDGKTDDLFPLFMTLRDLAPKLDKLGVNGRNPHNILSNTDKKSLVKALVSQWREDIIDLGGEAFCGHALHEMITSGRVLLIFDGLDEVPHTARRSVWQTIAAFLEGHPQIAQVIVTCRIRSYVGETRFEAFSNHTLAPFDEEKIRSFIAGWYNAQMNLGHFKEAQTAQRTADLQEAATSKDLAPLAQNPLLLTTMAVIHHQQETSLPKQRVVLYDRAVDVLLRRWQQAKGVVLKPELEALLNDPRRIRPLLEQLAYDLHSRQAESNNARLKWGDLYFLLQQPAYLGSLELAHDFLHYIDQKAGLLVGNGGGATEGVHQPEYDFPHRTFQEYLAGCYVVTGRPRAIVAQLQERAAEGDYWTVATQLGFEELYHNLRQGDTLLDLAYPLCPERWPDEVTTQREMIWSGYIAQLVGESEIAQDRAGVISGARYLEQLRGHLVQLIQDEASQLTLIERGEAGRILSKIGDPRPGVALKDNLPDIDWGETVPVGRYSVGGDAQAWRGFDEQEIVIDDAYQLGRYLVTYAQFQCFVEAADFAAKQWWMGIPQEDRYGLAREISDPKSVLTNHPRETVSWYQAVAFCRWLSEKLGYEVRLPHEYEWEVAARFNDGRFYPWGTEFEASKGNTEEGQLGQTTAVGLYPTGIQSELGLFDMSGNVWEWCLNKDDDPRDVTVDVSADDRVLRGGSFDFNDDDARASVRVDDHPDARSLDVGFRLCRVRPPISS